MINPPTVPAFRCLAGARIQHSLGPARHVRRHEHIRELVDAAVPRIPRVVPASSGHAGGGAAPIAA